MTHKTHVAVKEHKCVFGKDCVIKKGDIYVEETLAPWLNVLDDVDDEGHAIGAVLGRWEHWRYHQECKDKLYGGYVDY